MWSQFHTLDPQILGVTVRNLVAPDDVTPEIRTPLMRRVLQKPTGGGLHKNNEI